MDTKSTILMLVLIDDKVAEYQEGINDFFWLQGNSSGLPIHITKKEALNAAMDYHETEGCKLYLELYPAPEKNGWSYIAQDASGKWYGYDYRPNPSISSWFAEEGEEFPMIQSPPNPFWRKTLQ